MAKRLARNFDNAVEASLRKTGPDELAGEVTSYLGDAHAIEAQAIQLLEQAPAMAGGTALAQLFRKHLDQSRAQQAAVAARLDAHGATPSRLKDALLRIGGLNLGGFFGAQPDTPAKLAGFAFAFEHLEIAAYELLRGIAERAADRDTIAVAERILVEERHAAERIAATWDAAMDAALEGLVAESAP